MADTKALVERLRSAASFDQCPYGVSQLYRAAADEIERLTASQAAQQEPVARQYEYVWPTTGEPVWRFDGGPWNGQTPRGSRPLYAHPADAQDAADAAKYRALNTPELHDFREAVQREALHQRERWGTNHDGGKEPQDWFWLVGYLAGKALRSHLDHVEGNVWSARDKALHHTITVAAACANWHAAILGVTNMQPGHAPSVERGDRALAREQHAAALAREQQEDGRRG